MGKKGAYLCADQKSMGKIHKGLVDFVTSLGLGGQIEVTCTDVIDLQNKVKHLQAKVDRYESTLKLISKNKTEDCDIYTLGCDCDEEAIKALKKGEGK